mmetsp:Transcript_114140/g.198388  ORF Transcript_114140/g.198388 Transcript_114140/m.198388 type:complete len:2032 (-) Transcript_114140:1069-7164(-)
MNPQQVLGLVDKQMVRLASADDSKLEGVLDTVLPQLLQLLGFPDATVRNKVMELVNHVNTRVKSQPHIKLPVQKILNLWSTALLNKGSPFIVNFSILYLKMGYERASPADKSALLPMLLKNLSLHSRDNQMTLLGMVLQGVLSRTSEYGKNFEVPTHLKGDWASGRPTEDFLYQYYKPTEANSAALDRDVTVVLDYFCSIILYPAGTTMTSKTPPAMSPVDVRMVLNGKEELSSKDILPIKLNILRFLKSHLQRHIEAKQQSAEQHKWLASKVLTLSIASTCDAQHEVVSAGETLLKQYVEPVVDFECKESLLPLYELLLGNSPLSLGELRFISKDLGAPQVVATDIAKQRSPAPETIQLKALALLCKSLSAVNECWPQNAFVIRRSLSDPSGRGKLLSSGLQYLMWMLNNGKPTSYKPYAADMLDILCSLRASSLKSTGHEAQSIRGSLYVAIGYLCKQCKDVVGQKTDLLETYFESLETEVSHLKSSIQEGMAHLCTALWPLRQDLQQYCADLFLANAMKENKEACQLSALQCTNKLFNFEHSCSRLICLLLAEHSYLQIREESSKGLGVATFKQQKGQFESLALELQTTDTPVSPKPRQEYPDFVCFLHYVCNHLKVTRDTSMKDCICVSPKTLVMITQFTFRCLLHSATRCVDVGQMSEEHKAVISKYLVLQLGCSEGKLALDLFFILVDLCLYHTADLVAGSYVSADAALNPNSVTLGNSLVPQDEDLPLMPLLIVAHLSQTNSESKARYAKDKYVDLYLKVLVKGPKQVRECAAIVLGHIASALTKEVQMDVFQKLGHIHTEVTNKPEMATLNSAPEANALHGAVLGYAALLQAVYDELEASKDQCTMPLHRPTILLWYKVLLYNNAHVVTAATKALGMAGQCGALWSLLDNVAKDGLVEGETTASENPADMPVSIQPALAEVELTAVLVIKGLLHLIKSHTNNRVVEQAISSLGCISMGLPVSGTLDLLVEGLFGIVVARLTAVSVSAKKDKSSAESGGYQGEETQFTFGEALACVCGGSTKVGREDYSVKVARRLFSEFVVHRVPAIKRASAIWLLCLAQLCGAKVKEVSSPNQDEEQETFLNTTYTLDLADFHHLTFRQGLTRDHPCVSNFLKDYQKAFQYLLTDPNEITQEAASKGLTLIYSLGDKDSQSGLVASLVNMLNGGKSDMDVKISGDTELFPKDFIGKAPASSGVGNLSTYKDVCNLATEMGRPDLVYQFMSLASHHSLWNSKRAAAFGAVNIIRANFESIRPQLQAVLPKLYRNKFDPNQKIAEAMSSMWDSLLPGLQESRQAVDDNLAAIGKEVVAGLNHYQYRIREASLSALMDLLGGRTWSKLGGAVTEALPMVFRVMDDVKDTTAAIAKACARAIANFVVKSCTPQYADRTEIADCMDRILPILIDKGFNCPCKDVVQYAAQFLQRICHVGGASLRPHIPNIVHVCLEYKTALEPREFQYLQNMGDAQLTTEQIESVRVAMSSATPLSEAIKCCQPLCDAEVFVLLMPRLIDLLKTGVGLPTRSATAQFIGLAAKFHAPAISPYVPKLIETATLVLKHEGSIVVKKALANALGFVFRDSPHAQAEMLVQTMADSYTAEREHDETDDGIRVTAGIVLEELTNLAADKLKDLTGAYLPVAYIAMWDSNARAAEAWTEVWRANSGGDREGVNKHYRRILELLPQFFDHLSWKKRTQAAKCIHAICKQRHAEQPELLQAVYTQLTENITKGRVWEGKEHLFDALAMFFETCCFASAGEAGTGGMLLQLEQAVQIVFKECSKPRKNYRLRAHRALVSLLTSSYQHRPLTGAVVTTTYSKVLGTVLELLESGEALQVKDEEDDDGEDGGPADVALAEGQARDANLSGAHIEIKTQLLQAAGQAWMCSFVNTDTARAHAADMEATLQRLLGIFNRHLQEVSLVSTQLVVLKAAQSTITHLVSIERLDRGILTSAYIHQLVQLGTSRLTQFTERDVRVAALHLVGVLYSKACRLGFAGTLPGLQQQLEAMLSEEDISLQDNARRYLDLSQSQSPAVT